MPATINPRPDFSFDPKPRGVRQMLEEAGAYLKEETGNLVEFRVLPPLDWYEKEYPIRYRCDLYVQKLDYSFPFISVVTSETGFPTKVITAAFPLEPPKPTNESELRKALAAVFQSEHTKGVVQNLISMATD